MKINFTRNKKTLKGDRSLPVLNKDIKVVKRESTSLKERAPMTERPKVDDSKFYLHNYYLFL